MDIQEKIRIRRETLARTLEPGTRYSVKGLVCYTTRDNDLTIELESRNGDCASWEPVFMNKKWYVDASVLDQAFLDYLEAVEAQASEIEERRDIERAKRRVILTEKLQTLLK